MDREVFCKSLDGLVFLSSDSPHEVRVVNKHTHQAWTQRSIHCLHWQNNQSNPRLTKNSYAVMEKKAKGLKIFLIYKHVNGIEVMSTKIYFIFKSTH